MIKIACVCDELTFCALKCPEIKSKNLSYNNWKNEINRFKPDLLLVESSWKGYKKSWANKIAKNQNSSKDFNSELGKLVAFCSKNNIPHIFWNKEDPVHFDRFIDSAKFFNNILTIDNGSIQKYKIIGLDRVAVMPFFINPKIHSFKNYRKVNKTLFYGSFSNHIHEKRRDWQKIAFKVANKENGLIVFDRNFFKFNKIYKYPSKHIGIRFPKVPYQYTSFLAGRFKINLSYSNFISQTAFSRRLLEILASGSICITNKTDSHIQFKDMIFQCENEQEIIDAYNQINKMKPNEYFDFINAASKSVIENFSLSKILLKEIESAIS